METTVRRTTAPAALALVVLALGACGGPAGPGGATEDREAASAASGDGDPAGAWVLVDSDPPIAVPADARVTLEVEPDGNGWQAGGTAACNAYGGTVRIDGAGWEATGYGQTGMACDEPRMATERAYLDALATIDTWERPTADELLLRGSTVELRFVALPPVPLATLTDTTWVLDMLLTGVSPDGTVSSTAPGAEAATLRLSADGTLAASTGCRTFDGEWSESGDEVLFTTFGQTHDSPNVADDGTTTCDAAVAAQEDHVLAVLGDGFRAEVDGPRLTLAGRDGLGLGYLASDGSDGSDAGTGGETTQEEPA
jgi:heat shock protein HslJ